MSETLKCPIHDYELVPSEPYRERHHPDDIGSVYDPLPHPDIIEESHVVRRQMLYVCPARWPEPYRRCNHKAWVTANE